MSSNVKRLHEMEEKYATLVLEIEKRLTVVEDAAVGDNSLEVGSYFPKNLLLTDIPTEESVELEVPGAILLSQQVRSMMRAPPGSPESGGGTTQ